MAGHSKWANIKFRKAAQDAKRGKVFTKLIRAITIAAREGGEDLDSNPHLRDAIEKALKANMKRDTVNNAIKRGVGGGDEEQLFELRYEGYAPGGVAILVYCLSDNKNRTVAEVRHAFSKYGGNLSTENSVGYLFTKQGQFLFPPGSADEDLLWDLAIEAGAEDVVKQEDGSIEITTAPSDYIAVKEAMQDKGLEPEHCELTMVASNQITLDKVGAEKYLKLVDVLEELDDVQNIYSNADICEEILEQLS